MRRGASGALADDDAERSANDPPTYDVPPMLRRIGSASVFANFAGSCSRIVLSAARSSAGRLLPQRRLLPQTNDTSDRATSESSPATPSPRRYPAVNVPITS